MAGSNFEVQLGQLADAQITQDAPSLSPYKVGFQIIDKNDDETRGVGVSVFKMNGQWIYIPVFYLNGSIKGLDLMFLPDRGQFVPTTETWIAYLKGQQPLNLGEASDQEEENISDGKPGAVDIKESGRSAFSKISALLLDGAWEDMTTAVPFEQNVCDLREWIPRLGKSAAVRFTAQMIRQPEFANAVLKFYAPGDLRGIAKRAEEISQAERDALKANGSSDGEVELKVITPDMPDAKKLTDGEKEVLTRDGVFVVDNRKETSTVFKGDVDHKSLSTPTSDGLHDVLMADGTFNRFYILFPNKSDAMSRPSKEVLRTSVADFIMVPLNNKDVYLDGKACVQAKKLDINQSEDTDILRSLGRNVQRIVRERCTDVVVLDDYGNSYQMMFRGPKTAFGGKIKVCMKYGVDSCRKVDSMQFTGRNGKLFVGSGTLYVPDGAKVVERAPHNIREKYGFGNPNTLVNSLIDKVGLKPLKVYSDGTRVTLSDDRKIHEPLNKMAAMVRLVTGYGVEAATAKRMIKEASAGRGPSSVRYLLKMAQAPFMNTSENAVGAQTAPNTEEETIHPSDGLSDVETAIKASDNGVKEVMDVSVLRSLAMSGDALGKVDEYLPDLLRGLDRVGRLLFLFYWHNDEFAERYGRDDMTEMEESLRDVFQSLSDLVLFLSKKTVSPSAGAEAVAGDLSEDLAAS